MTQEQSRGLLITLCKELLTKHPGKAKFSFDEMVTLMAARYCHNYLALFTDAWVSYACPCGQPVCPVRLRTAIQKCIESPPSRTDSQNAPTSGEIH